MINDALGGVLVGRDQYSHIPINLEQIFDIILEAVHRPYNHKIPV